MKVSRVRRNKIHRQMKRKARRKLVTLLMMPARLPRITEDIISQAMKACEVMGVIFVALLMLHLISSEIMSIVFVIIAAVIFAGLLAVIELGFYQRKLEELNLFGYTYR